MAFAAPNSRVREAFADMQRAAALRDIRIAYLIEARLREKERRALLTNTQTSAKLKA